MWVQFPPGTCSKSEVGSRNDFSFAVAAVSDRPKLCGGSRRRRSESAATGSRKKILPVAGKRGVWPHVETYSPLRGRFSRFLCRGSSASRRDGGISENRSGLYPGSARRMAIKLHPGRFSHPGKNRGGTPLLDHACEGHHGRRFGQGQRSNFHRVREDVRDGRCKGGWSGDRSAFAERQEGLRRGFERETRRQGWGLQVSYLRSQRGKVFHARRDGDC